MNFSKKLIDRSKTLIKLMHGAKKYCVICDRETIHVEFSGRKYAKCNECCSLERHRLAVHLFKLHAEECGLIGKMIYLGPDALSKYLERYIDLTITTCDLYREDVDMRVDLANMNIWNEEVDYFIALHTLDAIKEDDKAIDNILKALRNGGYLLVPVQLFGQKTVELGKNCGKDIYGYDDRLRLCGNDYDDKFKKRGLKVKRKIFANEYKENEKLSVTASNASGIECMILWQKN